MDTRHPQTARADDSVLVVVDCQTKLWKVIPSRQALEERIPLAIEGARALGVPVVATEQYPKGLGATTARIKRAVADDPFIDKLSFSCWGEPRFQEHVRGLRRGALVLCGVEAHVCILQTALDALASGYRVHVLADGVGSRDPANVELAFHRLRAAGAVVRCVEAVLFEWMDRCDHEAFKTVVELVK